MHRTGAFLCNFQYLYTLSIFVTLCSCCKTPKQNNSICFNESNFSAGPDLFPKTGGNWYQSFGNDKAGGCSPSASKLGGEAPCEPSGPGKRDHGLGAHFQSSESDCS